VPAVPVPAVPVVAIAMAMATPAIEQVVRRSPQTVRDRGHSGCQKARAAGAVRQRL
jgi:hypothetical protein